MKQISIVIATWNAAKTLSNCLDSIKTQLTDEIEIIIIDGGSTDDTNKIIASYGNIVSYTISEKDKGIYDAWNKGIKVANGKWIAFIGADDILLPKAMNSYLEAIHTTQDIDTYDYICAHNDFVDMKGKLLKILGNAPKWSIMRRTMAAAHVASLHNKKNLFETVGKYDLSFKICADYEMLLRKKNHLKYLMLNVHIARMKVGGMSFSTNAIKEAYLIRKKHQTVPSIINWILFFRDWTAYNFFIIRKQLFGGVLNESSQ